MPLPMVVFEGRVVDDPELRFAPSGVAVCHMRVVANQQKKTEAGEWVDDKSCWLNVTTFKALAEHVAESFRKGDLVQAVGKLETRSYETRDGEKRLSVDMIADQVGLSVRFRNIDRGAIREGNTAVPQSRSAAADDEPPF